MNKKITNLASILLILVMIMTNTFVFADGAINHYPWYKLATNKEEYGKILKEANSLFPVGSYYKKQQGDEFMSDKIEQGNLIIHKQLIESDEKYIEQKRKFGYKVSDVSDIPNIYMILIQGHGYKVPFAPIINYKKTGKTTVGKVLYFKDGAIAFVKVDQSKRQGGAMELWRAVEKIKTDESGKSDCTRYLLLDSSSNEFRRTAFICENLNNSSAIYSNIYDNAKNLIGDVAKFSIGILSKDSKGKKYGVVKFKLKMFPFYLSDDNKSFIDVDDKHWAKYSIDRCRENGLISGVGDNKFNPDAPLSRAAVIQVLYNMWQKGDNKLATMKSPSNINFAKDVKDDDWYKNAVNWACANEIITLDANGNFNPNDIAKRGFTCKSIYNMSKNLDVGLPDWKPAKKFSDIDNSDKILDNAVQKLQRAEIIGGYSDGYFHPNDNLTRAQMAIILDKLSYAKSQVEIGYYEPQK